MNATELLKKIKAVFEDVQPTVEPAAAVAPVVEMKEYSLKDGTKVMIDKLEPGGKVATVDANGAQTQAAEGEYILADGSTIEVDATGLITEVSPGGEVETEPMPEMMTKTEFSVAENSLKDELKLAKDELKALKAAFKDLVSLVEQSLELPATEPTEPQKNAFGFPKNERERRIQEIQETFSKNKN
jgi:hypothetical protein